jgi:NTP pyrophosphatase (non-canonical NTP hydrolase)
MLVDEETERVIVAEHVATAAGTLVAECHGRALRNGWWTDPKTGESLIGKRNVGETLMLIVSELSEAMEGHRKGLMDDKLPHRSMIEVELADAMIRIADMAGAMGLDLGGAVAEKLDFNDRRPDHKIENRLKPGGKAY